MFSFFFAKDEQISIESLQNVCELLVESACHGKEKRESWYL